MLEPDHRVVDLVVVDLLACGQPAVGRLVPCKQRFLPGLRVLQLCLEARNVIVEFCEAFVHGRIIRFDRVGGILYP